MSSNTSSPKIPPSSSVTVCAFYNGNGCRYGDTCKYLHIPDYERPVCKYFATREGCKYGPRCFYLHDRNMFDNRKTRPRINNQGMNWNKHGHNVPMYQPPNPYYYGNYPPFYQQGRPYDYYSPPPPQGGMAPMYNSNERHHTRVPPPSDIHHQQPPPPQYHIHPHQSPHQHHKQPSPQIRNNENIPPNNKKNNHKMSSDNHPNGEGPNYSSEEGVRVLSREEMKAIDEKKSQTGETGEKEFMYQLMKRIQENKDGEESGESVENSDLPSSEKKSSVQSNTPNDDEEANAKAMENLSLDDKKVNGKKESSGTDSTVENKKNVE